MATLMFWNKQNANNNQNNNEAKNGKKNWLHAPDALVNGHVAYLVKFLGSTPVEQAKGIDTVKDAIRRLQFAQQLKKAESGNNVKSKKVEITISVDGVAVQEPRAQKILHQFPLHNISYCADEKGVKKFFSFIAKSNPVQNGVSSDNTNGHAEDSHECFVFISSKLASDITLTIGQAFELAYRRFVNDNGKGGELTKLQSENKQLEKIVAAYKQRLKDVVDLVSKSDIDKYLLKHGIRDVYEMPQENGIANHVASINGKKSPDLDGSLINDDQLLIETAPKQFPPIVPPRNLQTQLNNTFDAFKPSVGTKLEGLLLNSDSDSDFDPRADEEIMANDSKISNDFFGFEPPKPVINQQSFNNSNNINNINNNNNNNNMSATSTINHSLTNGVTRIASSPPPLLAPPPKAALPRRSGQINNTHNNNVNNNNNNNINNNNHKSQDIFGSIPFSTPAIHPSPFDASGLDTFNSSIALDESMNSSLNTSQNFKNPFSNESATSNNNETNYNFNNSDNNNSDKYQVLSELSAISTNFDRLNDILKNNQISSSSSQNSENTKKNPFTSETQTNLMNGKIGKPKNVNLTDLKGMDLTKSNPFSNTVEMGLSKMSTSQLNYESFKNTFECGTIELEAANHSINGGKQQTITNSNNATISNDLFKDAAVAAFGEFKRTNKYEFSNKMADLDKNNFGKPLSFSADDFTLESLDPLRK